ncbi:MAG: hypothetical protein LBU83_00190 [Bacteroidales bacterium]|jgi:hypothetical protein|nr:hypothetical protein [Bacteroidales bacterium]
MSNSKFKIQNSKFFLCFCAFVLSAFCFLPFSLFSQNESTPPEEPVKTEIDLLKEGVENNLIEIKKLKKLKISGYIQAQFEVGQEFASTKVGASTFDNRRDGKYKFDDEKGYGKSNTDNFFRFGIRRGRIKIAWEESFGSAVFQLDLTEKGVGIKDAYLKVSEPWLNVFSLTAGIFDRPFGDEISYSSSRRESPERTQLCQALFPDERDLGVMITIAGPKGSAVDGLKLDAGAFCGNGITLPDNGKMDFIGHLKYDKRWSNVSFGIGASMYYGTVRNINTTFYTIKKNDEGVKTWVGDKVDTLQKNIRQYYGIDAQFAAQTSWGITNIRGEVWWGNQPCVEGNINSPKWNLFQTGTSGLQNVAKFDHIRKFWGAHVYFIQDIYKTPLTVVLKYAFMNPNTKIGKDAITNAADLSYNYLGMGLLVRCTSYLRLMLFYDMPFNSTKNGFKAPAEDAKPATGFNHVKDYTKDLKDGVFTCRLQFKF